jgi:hypothetical protein
VHCRINEARDERVPREHRRRADDARDDNDGFASSDGNMKSKIERTFTGKASYHKFDIARDQIETAIRLFLTDGADMFSAIALAANAGDLFHALVVRTGKAPFIDDVAVLEGKRNPGQTPPRYKLITHVHQVLFMNEVKHLDDAREEGDEIVEFDAEEAAIGAILKAIADYQTFTGERSRAMNAFLGWCHQNLDGEAIMEEFQQAGKTDGV